MSCDQKSMPPRETHLPSRDMTAVASDLNQARGKIRHLDTIVCFIKTWISTCRATLRAALHDIRRPRSVGSHVKVKQDHLRVYQSHQNSQEQALGMHPTPLKMQNYKTNAPPSNSLCAMPDSIRSPCSGIVCSPASATYARDPQLEELSSPVHSIVLYLRVG